MAKKTTTKSKNIADIIVDSAAIILAKSNIVKVSGDIMSNTNEMKKLVNKYEDYWTSTTATYHKNTLVAKINEIEQEQETLNNNLKKFFNLVADAYDKSETAIKSNAEQFK